MAYIDKQMEEAKTNLDYFVKKLIYLISKYLILVFLSIIICNFSNDSIINSILLFIFIYAIIKIYYIYHYYIKIIKDIKNTAGIDINFVIIDRILKYSK